ncbi:unnamed protein product [Pieris macdunnoughi]|uniref:Reverse transcriptase domain-containing protein n=1 Tax=Pieris macdunnoughi TaxID=345717 RepID=A0A821XIE8_9NEOP|nr:unnamed protein product [Pieris macdunnoughi]
MKKRKQTLGSSKSRTSTTSAVPTISITLATTGSAAVKTRSPSTSAPRQRENNKQEENRVTGHVQHPPLAVSLRLIPNVCSVVSSTTGAAQSYSRGQIGISNDWSKWNFNKADYHILYTPLLPVDWGTLYSLSDVDEMVVYFTWSFWQYVKDHTRPLKREGIVTDGINLTEEERANEFAQFFKSVYSAETPQLDVNAAAAYGTSSARVHLDDFTLREVSEALVHLKPKRSAGSDGLPPFLFRDCERLLAAPLHHIFSTCLKSNIFPAQWKTTRVTPVPKGIPGPDIPAQLRDEQHGFRPGHSTTMNLLDLMMYTMMYMYLMPVVDAGGQVDVVYLDIKKAFDTVDNDILLRKLAAFGCIPKLLHF